MTKRVLQSVSLALIYSSITELVDDGPFSLGNVFWVALVVAIGLIVADFALAALKRRRSDAPKAPCADWLRGSRRVDEAPRPPEH